MKTRQLIIYLCLLCSGLFPFLSAAQTHSAEILIAKPHVTTSYQYTLLGNNKVIKMDASNTNRLVFSSLQPIVYKLVISSECCRITSVAWHGDTLMGRKYTASVVLKERQINLNEVTIKGKSQTFVQQGDTLIIRTEQVETKPHADASAIFDEISGLRIDDNGNISVLGKRVRLVKIDNRQIFGGNPQLTLQNLRADMIKQMEFIEKTLANGQKLSYLNLRLKEDKKTGTFGEVATGSDLSKRYLGQMKATSLTKKGIGIGYLSGNNINESSKQIYPAMGTEQHLVAELMEAGSMLGVQKSYHHAENAEQMDLNVGNNAVRNAAANINVEKAKTQLSIYGTYQGIIQDNKQEGSSLVQLLNNQQLTELSQLSKTSNKAGFLIGSYRHTLSDKMKFWLDTDVRLNDQERKISANQRITSQLSTLPLSIASTLLNAERKNSYAWQSGITLNGQKAGSKSLIYYYGKYANNLINKVGNYSDFVSRGFDQTANHLDWGVELVKSYSIWKRVFFEHRLGIISNSSDGQQTDKMVNQLTDFSISTRQFDLINYLHYQHYRWKAFVGIGGWHYRSSRQLGSRTHDPAQNFIGIRQVSFTQNFMDASSLQINYNVDLKHPQWRSVISPTDSILINSLRLPNITLLPSKKHEGSIYYNKNFNNGYRVTLTARGGLELRAIILSQQLYTNEFIQTAELNSPKEAKVWQFDTHIFKSENQQGISHEAYFSFQNQYGWFGTNDRIAPLRNLSSQFRYYFHYKPKLPLKFSQEVEAAHFKAHSASLMQFSHKLQLKYTFRKKWFFEAKHFSQFASKSPFQTILNLSAETFLLKNKGLGLTLLGNNILNRPYRVIALQDFNQSYYNRESILPRVILLKATVYPDTWK